METVNIFLLYFVFLVLFALFACLFLFSFSVTTQRAKNLEKFFSRFIWRYNTLFTGKGKRVMSFIYLIVSLLMMIGVVKVIFELLGFI